jgi:hypothetical protein
VVTFSPDLNAHHSEAPCFYPAYPGAGAGNKLATPFRRSPSAVTRSLPVLLPRPVLTLSYFLASPRAPHVQPRRFQGLRPAGCKALCRPIFRLRPHMGWAPKKNLLRHGVHAYLRPWRPLRLTRDLLAASRPVPGRRSLSRLGVRHAR